MKRNIKINGFREREHRKRYGVKNTLNLLIFSPIKMLKFDIFVQI